MPKRIKKSLAVCMIVQDDEKTLPLLLSDVREFADEIVVVDTGSRDRTRETALDFTDRVYDFAWNDDFSAARNYALSLAGSDYLMWLDAGDRVPVKSRAALNELLYDIDGTDLVMLPYETAFDETGATMSYYRERILKRDAGFRFVDPVHEIVVPHGKIEYRQIPIERRKIKRGALDRNLKIYRNLLAEGTPLSARQKFYYANELTRNGEIDLAVQAYRDFILTPGGTPENRAFARLTLARLQKDDPKTAAETLLSGFYESAPTAETWVELGHIMMREQRFREAIGYYLSAMNADRPPLQFRNADAEHYIPALQIALCYFKLGDPKNAAKYNDLALAAKPAGTLALHNRKFYQTE